MADFLGVEAVIPWRDFNIRAVFIGNGLHVRDFFFDPCNGGRPNRFHKLDCALWRLSHAVFEAPLGIIVIAEQGDALITQLKDFGDDGIVIMLIAIISARIISLPDFLAQIPLGGIGQERRHRGARIGDGILPVFAIGRGCCSCCFDKAFRQTAELVFGDIKDITLFIGEDIIGKVCV